ncbi:hypothetical protein K438DRAFT_1995054 [Mycena galopus ATCC 62051]|nr:hypothetical protein K438DRAFT_1995054 [Mycena galopus ATCC 62051]
MASSARKDIVEVIGIHTAPPHFYKEEFEAKFDAYLDDVLAPPNVWRNFLKYEVLRQNDRFDEYLESYGCIPREPMVVVRAQVEPNPSVDHLISTLRYSESAKLLRVLAFTLELASSPRILNKSWITIPPSPLRIAFTSCLFTRSRKTSRQNNMAKTFQKARLIVLSQAQTLNQVQLFQISALDAHIDKIGYSQPEPTFIAHVELETCDNVVDTHGNRPSVHPPDSGPSHCPAASSDPSSNAYSASGLARPFRLTRTSALARNVVLHPSGLHSPSFPFIRPLALERTMRSSSGSLPITSDTCYWLAPIKTSPSVGILILSSLRILPLVPALTRRAEIAKFGVDSDSDRYASAPASPTSNLDPFSLMDAPTPGNGSAQPELPDVHIPDSAPDPETRLTAVEDSLANIETLLLRVLHNSQNPPATAPVPAAPAPAAGPDFTTLTPAAKSVLRPNPPAVFDGDRIQGRMFLHSVLTLVLEAFMVHGQVVEEKLVRYAMSFMARDAAGRWAVMLPQTPTQSGKVDPKVDV